MKIQEVRQKVTAANRVRNGPILPLHQVAPPLMSGHPFLLAAFNPFAAMESHHHQQDMIDNFKPSSSGIRTSWSRSEGSGGCKIQVHSVNRNNEKARPASAYQKVNFSSFQFLLTLQSFFSNGRQQSQRLHLSRRPEGLIKSAIFNSLKWKDTFVL